MASQNFVKTSSGNRLLPDATQQLPEPMLILVKFGGIRLRTIITVNAWVILYSDFENIVL